jgi:crossover junction endodeoxyribonuclease RuvC
MVIIGIDPGLAHTGYGVLNCGADRPEVMETGVVRTAAALPLEKRLHQLHRSLAGVFDRHSPDMTVVEGLFSRSRNPASAILMGHARGVILMLSAGRGIPVKTYPPAKIKRSLTGNGNCTKQQILKMVQLGLALEEMPESEHIGDALAAVLCHIRISKTEAAIGSSGKADLS